MLRHLSIHNFAIIKQVNLDFSNGMTVLSGETGAGKSIIIDALSLILGARGSTDFIRYGEDKFSIEALFQFKEHHFILEQLLMDHGLDIDLDQDDLIISREINQTGKNLIRINGNLANVSLLKKIGGYLGDIHGQNEHQQLLDAKQHLLLLDSFADEDHQQLLMDYQQAYCDYKQERQNWLEASQRDNNLHQRLNFLTYQLEELTALNLNVEEEEKLAQQSKAIQDFQQSQMYLQAMMEYLSDGEINTLSLLDQSIDAMQSIKDSFKDSEAYIKRLTTARYDIEDIAHQVSQEATNDHMDIEELDDIEERLATIGSVKRKYGMTVDELIQYQEDMSEEIDTIVNRESYLNRLQEKVRKAYQRAYLLAEQVSKRRKDIAQQLSQAVERELADLYMKNSQFFVKFSEVDSDTSLEDSLGERQDILQLNANGCDIIEFYVITNVGDVSKPLVKVASGGELSRFMLALKSVFSKNLSEKVMVFDEIDTGVSGRVGFAIAKKIYGISNHHQVLAITHLPPVAAISDQQLYIAKSTTASETHTQVRELNEQERYQVIGKMMSGETINDHTIAVVEDMIRQLHYVDN